MNCKTCAKARGCVVRVRGARTADTRTAHIPNIGQMCNARNTLVGTRVLCSCLWKGEKCLLILCQSSINNGMPNNLRRLGESGSALERQSKQGIGTGRGGQLCSRIRGRTQWAAKYLKRKDSFYALKRFNLLGQMRGS